MGPLARTFADRLLAVGDAAGLTKPTTGGGIFYSLLSGALAAETIVEAFRRERFGEEQLSRYEGRWRTRLGPELRTAAHFRAVLTELSDRQIDSVLAAVASADIHEVIHRTAKFNWHRNVILTILRLPGIRSVLLRSFFR
jgi:flavin-dependent dehydrogenase